MADRIQNIIRRLENSPRFSDSDDEEEIPVANGVVNKRPRFSESTSQSQPQPQIQSRTPIYQSQPVQRSRPRPQSRCLMEFAEGLIPVQEVEVESESESGSEGFDVEDDEGEFEAEEEEEEDGGSDYGGEDDEAADGVADGHHHHHHRHQVTASTAASSQLGQSNSGGRSRSCSAVAAAFNNATGAIPVMLTDPDVLDCPICLEPLCTPIYQCENGHIACSICCLKAKRKCPSCCLPIGFNRCRAMEKLIESVRVECKNAMFGCKETVVYSKKTEHEQMCALTACVCPHSPCTFASSSKNLYLHFGSQHATSATSFSYDTTFSLTVERSQKYVLLQERNEGVIFVLNHDVQGHGRVFNVDCIGPSTFNCAFLYLVTAKCMETSLSLQSVPDVQEKWQQHTPKKNYLTVPSDFSGYGGQLSVQVCIKKAHSVV